MQNTKPTICWIDEGFELPGGLDFLSDSYRIASIPVGQIAKQLPADAILLIADSRSENIVEYERISHQSGIMLAVIASTGDLHVSEVFETIYVLPADFSSIELAAMVKAADITSKKLAIMREKFNSQPVANSDIATTNSFGDELQMAARLQRDFLPHKLPRFSNAKFSAIYQPVSFVSGDIYDVMRLDETHVGFYVADAVGHGLPAALLTMFIKKALQTKKITGNTYEIISPEIALGQLNSDLASQKLSMCEFCTAAYCVLNTKTLELFVARAGHPEPIIVHSDKSVDLLKPEGPLLGIIENAEFELQKIQLKPGDRFMLYSDGLEDSIAGRVEPTGLSVAKLAADGIDKPREEFLTSMMKTAESLGPVQDDMTVIALDIS